MQRAKIISDGTRNGTKVFFNDTDITACVSRITWEGDVNKNHGLPCATITFYADVELTVSRPSVDVSVEPVTP